MYSTLDRLLIDYRLQTLSRLGMPRLEMRQEVVVRTPRALLRRSLRRAIRAKQTVDAPFDCSIAIPIFCRGRIRIEDVGRVH